MLDNTKGGIRRLTQRLFHTGLALAGLFGGTVAAQGSTGAADSADLAWPRQLESGPTTHSVYQPQVESWTGNRLATRSAVAVLDSGAAEPTFDVIWLSARTPRSMTV